MGLWPYFLCNIFLINMYLNQLRILKKLSPRDRMRPLGDSFLFFCLNGIFNHEFDCFK